MINDKEKNKGSMIKFLDNKGFYILLFICIGTITITAFVVTKRNIASYMADNSFEKITHELSGEEELNKLVKPNPQIISDIPVKEFQEAMVSESDNIVSNNNAIAKEDMELAEEIDRTVIETNSFDKIKLELPIKGKIIKDYTKDSLIYSRTLDQWTTHSGIDIEAKRGEPVRAAYNGIVTEVYNDAVYGSTIIIKHDNGLETRYSNLSTIDMVTKGLKVKMGDVISGVGSTSLFESQDEPHIHFEVILDGQTINPNEYLQ